MKFILLFFYFLWMSLYAEVQWIPLETEKQDEKPKKEIILPKIGSVNTLVDNIKVIQHLIDKKSDTAEPKQESQKNWFSIKNTQNN